jgi:peptidoglycan/LPS O-acetylase OafA/YrhL
MCDHFNLPFSSSGYLGVDIFFALSGFLITTILLEDWVKHNRISLGRFYVNRVARLYPPLLFMLLFMIPFAPKIYLFSSLAYFTNWIMALRLQPFFGALAHLWSLSIEEQYYLVWPILLIILLRKLPPKFIIAIPLCLAILCTVNRILVWNADPYWYRFYSGTDTHIDGILYGSAFAMAVNFGLLPKWEKIKKALPILTVAVILGTIWLAFTKTVPDYFSPYFLISFAGLGTVVIISRLVVYPSRILKRIFEWKPLVGIGKVSYGLYLWHVPVINTLQFENFGWSPLAVLLARLIVVVMFTLLSYRYIEKPIQKLRVRLQSTRSVEQPLLSTEP